MSWKKNVFGCMMWVVYLLMVAAAMIFTGRMICDFWGLAVYLKIVIPAVYLLFTGIIVFALHRLAVGLKINSQSVGKTIVWIERVLVFVMFGAGIFLRVLEMQPELFVKAAGSDYLKLAYISVDGQEIPQFSHGAVYLYVWVTCTSVPHSSFFITIHLDATERSSIINNGGFKTAVIYYDFLFFLK